MNALSWKAGIHEVSNKAQSSLPWGDYYIFVRTGWPDQMEHISSAACEPPFCSHHNFIQD